LKDTLTSDINFIPQVSCLSDFTPCIGTFVIFGFLAG